MLVRIQLPLLKGGKMSNLFDNIGIEDLEIKQWIVDDIKKYHKFIALPEEQYQKLDNKYKKIKDGFTYVVIDDVDVLCFFEKEEFAIKYPGHENISYNKIKFIIKNIIYNGRMFYNCDVDVQYNDIVVKYNEKLKPRKISVLDYCPYVDESNVISINKLEIDMSEAKNIFVSKANETTEIRIDNFIIKYNESVDLNI